jgi:uncharacterized protein (DUF934 family)
MKFIDKAQDTWRQAAGEDGPIPTPLPHPQQLLTLEQWHAVRETWPAGLPTGVIFPNDADIETLAADLPRLALVVLQFPKWVDGRAYSQAHLLRSRLRYAGEVRAIGDVVVDMMPLLQRTGFSSAALRGDQKREHAERALEFFRGHYQGDVVQTHPLFKRAPSEREEPAPFLQEGASI